LLCIHNAVNNERYAITKLLVVIFTEKDVVWNFESGNQLRIDLTPAMSAANMPTSLTD